MLKFIGDSVLAMFPVLDGRAAATVCEAALDAALGAAAGMADLNRARRAAEAPVLRFGLGLHIGDVIYGNIGAASRLDFTVIGPAVNLVNRLEHLSRELDRPIVVSARGSRAACRAGWNRSAPTSFEGCASRKRCSACRSCRRCPRYPRRRGPKVSRRRGCT